VTASIPADISCQVVQTLGVLERHLAPTLVAVHLYGSAVDGGLKPSSDIDLLVTISTRLDDDVRQALMTELLAISAPPGESSTLRALEVTAVVPADIVPWRYPARRELQFGEWLREDIMAGRFEAAVADADLAILLTKARENSVALFGPPAQSVFNAVPEDDFYRVLSDTLDLWNAPADWEHEERNIVLTLARIWYSASTGAIAPKEVAGEWAVLRLPAAHKAVLREAQQAYLGRGVDQLALRGDAMTAFVSHMKREIRTVLVAREALRAGWYASPAY
jgi:predicted nucleotidyltransferase